MISILMAAYNAELTIKEAIDSVIAQTYLDWELIIINDCSKDKTKEIADSYALQYPTKIKVINNSQNYGVKMSRHIGLVESQGDYIAILDSDDKWTDDKLEKQIAMFSRYQDVSIVFTGSGFMDETGKKMSYILHAPETISYKELLNQNLISDSSAVVRKDIFKKAEDKIVAGNAKNFHEDYAIWLTILKNGGKVYGIDEPLLIYRLSSNSKSGNKVKSAIMTWNTYRAVGLSLPESIRHIIKYAKNGARKYKGIKDGRAGNGRL
ncbi:MAG: glycosyltransferase [Catonella sp.]|nr:glycosyltransferase [Catonella sp.]